MAIPGTSSTALGIANIAVPNVVYPAQQFLQKTTVEGPSQLSKQIAQSQFNGNSAIQNLLRIIETMSPPPDPMDLLSPGHLLNAYA
ncbi:MAG: hypothetical protein JW739_00990 [Opitutales bacterium]|nr:hypothetical protein [Opitutales bacterium]